MKLEERKEQENLFKSNLNQISRGRFKSKEQKSPPENIELFQRSQDAVIKLFNECSSIVSVAKHKARYGKGLKILPPKQMLQKLSIALAQVEAGNTSKNVLNEVRQIIYSLY